MKWYRSTDNANITDLSSLPLIPVHFIPLPRGNHLSSHSRPFHALYTVSVYIYTYHQSRYLTFLLLINLSYPYCSLTCCFQIICLEYISMTVCIALALLLLPMLQQKHVKYSVDLPEYNLITEVSLLNFFL